MPIDRAFKSSFVIVVIMNRFSIELNQYPTFNLEKAVCNHGFFMMAPNVWDPSTKCFSRPLRLADSETSVQVTVSQPPHQNHLLVQVHDANVHLSSSDKDAILVGFQLSPTPEIIVNLKNPTIFLRCMQAQVERMLRLSAKDEKDVQEFHKVHPEAKQRGFGRVFRSPSLFEDAVKCFLLCFCSFQSSLKMARLLCDIQFEMSNGCLIPYNSRQVVGKGLKRKHRSSKTQNVRNFPNAKELACLDINILQKHGKTGLRTFQILEFAQKVHSGRFQLRKFEECTSYKELSKQVRRIKGFGPYASANLLMFLGFYKDVPIDSETRRHLKEVHGNENCSGRVILEIYEKCAPFQCLAFWCELAGYYESKMGNLSELPSSMYAAVTGSLVGGTSNQQQQRSPEKA